MLLNDLTLNFDPFTISILKNEFKEREGIMGKDDFITIIKDHLIHWQLDIPNREKKLIRCLSLLFDDIDLNGNGNMEWDEFTNYIIEKAAVLNTMKSKNEEIKNYHPCNTKISGIKFNNLIVKTLYIKMINKIAFFEEESDVIYFADPDSGVVDYKKLHVKITKENKKSDGVDLPNYSADKAMLLDMIFIDDKKYNLLVTSSNDGIIRMFRYTSNGFQPADDSGQGDNQIVYDKAQVKIVWDNVDEILYSGQRDGVIKIWDQKSEPQFSQLGGKEEEEKKRGLNESMSEDSDDNFDGKKKKRRVLKGKKKVDLFKKKKSKFHNDVITCLLPLNKLQFLASASLDRKIILWDTIENRKKREYSGYHKKGIMALDFNENLILLISGGFDHQIFIWNPYIDSPVHNLAGHTAPIVSVKFVDNPLHIVTLDSDLTLKIWDARKFKNSDTISVEEFEDKRNFNPQHLCLLEKPLKLIIAGKSITLLEYDRHNNLTSADENVSICAKFIPSNLTLLTPVGKKIKVWNLLTGEIKKIFSDLTESDISCVNLDTRSKRLMVGDMDGFVGVFNVNNGALLKTLSRHKSEVINLVHYESAEEKDPNYIITASVDNMIKVHDDSELADSDFLRALTISSFNITCLEFDSHQKKIIIGGNNGLISLYEAATGKGNEEFLDKTEGKIQEEVTCLEVLSGLNCIIYAESNGMVKVIGIPPLVVKHSKLAEFQNYDADIKGKQMLVSSIIFCPETYRLFIADEKYYVRCYDISILCEICKAKLDDTMDKSRKDPKIPDMWIREIWRSRIHDDMIKSMEYVHKEELLFTTCVDRQVKISNAENGEFIESLRQRKDSQRIKPIAYKKVESEEIYTPRMEHRIDTRYMKLFREKKRKEAEMLKRQELGYLDNFNPEEEFLKELKKSEKKIDAFKEYEEQEFDPYYYTHHRIDFESIQNSRSNEWNLNLKFDYYYKEFEKDTDEIWKKIRVNENDILKKEKEEDREEITNKYKEVKKEIEDPKQVPQNIKKKLKKYNEKFVSVTAVEEAKLLKEMEERNKKNKRKARNKLYDNLYKKGLKHEMIKKMTHEQKKMKLSESEMNAAEKLAAALAQYDEDDPRSLFFTDYELRKPKKDLKRKKKKKTDGY